jgi:hypothetical protein
LFAKSFSNDSLIIRAVEISLILIKRSLRLTR